jgi:hypothetical protein
MEYFEKKENQSWIKNNILPLLTLITLIAIFFSLVSIGSHLKKMNYPEGKGKHEIKQEKTSS